VAPAPGAGTRWTGGGLSGQEQTIQERLKPPELEPVSEPEVETQDVEAEEAEEAEEDPSVVDLAAAGEAPQEPPVPPTTGRPLVLWAGDPRHGTALVLARFAASDLETAFGVASVWARRYDDLALGEAPRSNTSQPNVLAVWYRGRRQAL
jgi:hypothetical protein